MRTQPPEQNPDDYDEVTRLRLQLAHTETQRDAYAAALKTDVKMIAKVAIYQAAIDAGKDADADTIGCMGVELDDVKAENARLRADLQLEKENEDRLVREWQKANNEVHGLKAQVAALIDNQTSLKAEVERLTELNATIALRYDATKSMLDGCAKEIEEMEAEVERLTKAGDELHAFLINYIVESRISSAYLNKLDDGWHAAKEGKQP